MMRSVIALALIGLLSSCSATPRRAETSPDGPAFLLRGEGRSIPALADLALTDEAPPVTPVTELGDTRSFQIGDLRVIHKRTPANSVVQARVYIRGGLANLTAETAGIEELALGVASSGGTQSTPKDAFNAKLDATGAAIFSFTDRDFSGYGLKTLVDHFDANWELFVQTVLEPAMPEDEVTVRRQKQLASIASMLENPDRHLTYVAGQYTFAGHPYELLHIGTADNVNSFTRDELLAWQRAMLVPANMLVVVVGNLDTNALLERIRGSFGRIAPKRAAPIAVGPISSPAGVKFEPRELPTNYILGMFAAPAPGDDDYPALLIAMDYLRERLFEEVRTKRNLTYAVSSGLADQRTNYGYLYVTAVEPQTTMPVIFAEIAKLRTAPIPAEMLEQTVNVFITEHYMGLQTNGSQASMLAQAELVSGDWRAADALLGQIRAVTPADVQRVAQAYLRDYRFALVGPRTDADPGLFTGPQ